MALVRADGVRGLYRGFGTTIFGLIPARVVRNRHSLWLALAFNGAMYASK